MRIPGGGVTDTVYEPDSSSTLVTRRARVCELASRGIVIDGTQVVDGEHLHRRADGTEAHCQAAAGVSSHANYCLNIYFHVLFYLY